MVGSIGLTWCRLHNLGIARGWGYLCFPSFKEPDGLFLSGLNSAKHTSREFWTQRGWSVASSLEQGKDFENVFLSQHLTIGTTLMAPCPDNLRSSCMMGLNLGAGLFTWHLLPVPVHTWWQDRWSIRQVAELCSSQTRTSEPGRDHWEEPFYLVRTNAPSIKLPRSESVNDLGIWVELDQVVPKERDGIIDPSTQSLVSDEISPIVLRHLSINCLWPEGNISRGSVRSNPIVVLVEGISLEKKLLFSTLPCGDTSLAKSSPKLRRLT